MTASEDASGASEELTPEPSELSRDFDDLGGNEPDDKRAPRVKSYKVCSLQRLVAKLSHQVEGILLEGRQLVGWKHSHAAKVDLTAEDRTAVEAGHMLRLADIVQKTGPALIKTIAAHKWSFPFNQPVDFARFPTYRKIVASPMDFSTLRTRCEGGTYREPVELYADLMLIFNNAKLFNPPGSDCFLMAQTLQEFAQEKWDKAVVPRVQEEAGSVARDEAACRERRREAAHEHELEVVEQQAERLLGVLQELHAAVRDSKSLAASLVEPVTRPERQALAAALRGLPTAQLEAAVAFIAASRPELVDEVHTLAAACGGDSSVAGAEDAAVAAGRTVKGEEDVPVVSLKLRLGSYDALLLRQLQHLASAWAPATAAAADPAAPSSSCAAPADGPTAPNGNGSCPPSAPPPAYRTIADVVSVGALAATHSCGFGGAPGGLTWPGGMAFGSGQVAAPRSSLLLLPEDQHPANDVFLAVDIPTPSAGGAALLAQAGSTPPPAAATPTPSPGALPGGFHAGASSAPTPSVALRPSLKRKAQAGSADLALADAWGGPEAGAVDPPPSRKARTVTLVAPPSPGPHAPPPSLPPLDAAGARGDADLGPGSAAVPGSLAASWQKVRQELPLPLPPPPAPHAAAPAPVPRPLLPQPLRLHTGSGGSASAPWPSLPSPPLPSPLLPSPPLTAAPGAPLPLRAPSSSAPTSAAPVTSSAAPSTALASSSGVPPPAAGSGAPPPLPPPALPPPAPPPLPVLDLTTRALPSLAQHGDLGSSGGTAAGMPPLTSSSGAGGAMGPAPLLPPSRWSSGSAALPDGAEPPAGGRKVLDLSDAPAGGGGDSEPPLDALDSVVGAPHLLHDAVSGKLPPPLQQLAPPPQHPQQQHLPQSQALQQQQPQQHSSQQQQQQQFLPASVTAFGAAAGGVGAAGESGTHGLAALPSSVPTAPSSPGMDFFLADRAQE